MILATAKWADPDRIAKYSARGHSPSDPLYSRQYYLKNSITRFGVPVDINVENAWFLTKGSSSITVVVIDAGIDGTHPEFLGKKTCEPGYDAFSDDVNDIGGPWQPWGTIGMFGDYESLHGTNVAGIIAASHNGVGVAGVAPNVLLGSARIFRGPEGAFEEGTPAEIADAITWAWFTCGADVINGSWGGPLPSNAIDQAVANAASQGRGGKGTILVFAAGNTSDRRNGVIGSMDNPANRIETIGVGAIDSLGFISNYSARSQIYIHENPWNRLDLVVPSGHDLGGCNQHPLSDVATTDLSGSRGCNDLGMDYIESFSGTSAAAPQVAGAAALLLSLEPGLDRVTATSRLLDSADYWEGGILDFGHGKLNISASLGIRNPPPITSVAIVGSSQVRPNDFCTWAGNVVGGTAPHAFQWYKNGSQVGSGDELSISTGTSSFTLKFVVTDHFGLQKDATKQVTVTSSAFECFQ